MGMMEMQQIATTTTNPPSPQPAPPSPYYLATRYGARADHVAGLAACVFAAVALVVRLYVVRADNCQI